MILVTLGTQDKPFTRLLQEIEKEIINGNIKEEVIVQAGSTKFESTHMKIFDLIPMEELNNLINRCDLLITHGGVGSIITGLKNDKKVIGVARLKKYGEHVNDHQLQILENFSNEGYIIYVSNLNDLGKAIKEIKDFKPQKYQSNTVNMIKLLDDYIKNNSKVKKKTVNILFLIFFLLIIFGGFLKPLINPKDINYVENRMAYQIPNFSFQTFLNNEFQNNYEKALADQIPLSQKMKLLVTNSNMAWKLFYYKFNHNYYNDLGSINLIDDYLVYDYYNLENLKNALIYKSDNYNNIVEKIDNVDFYLYYIEKDDDINFETNEKVGVYEFLSNIIDNRVKKAKFSINNFNEYKKYFYKTDHHWNYKGSYKAYTELLKLLGVNEEPLKIEGVRCITNKMIGSKSAMVGGTKLFNEEFCYYKINMPKFTVYYNNQERNSYGDKELFFNDSVIIPSYGLYYGGDDGLIEFDFNNPNKENLLIIGESYDNAINDLLASHFNKTFNVDLRNYSNEFNINTFIKNNHITKVLFIGSVGFYDSNDFILKEDF